MKSKWENAHSLITAKMAIDSLLYLDKNFESIPAIDIRKFIESKRGDFYINLVNVIDEMGKDKKNYLRKNNAQIAKIIDLRNKKYAHDDKSFSEELFESRTEIINEMKSHLDVVFKQCSDILPSILTIDYVPHDRELFRIVNKVDATVEANIKSKRFKSPDCENISDTRFFKSFNHPSDIRCIAPEDRSKYCVIVEEGINEYEGLQNRQSSCICVNVLFDKDIWCTFNEKLKSFGEELRAAGLMDEFNIMDINELTKEQLAVLSGIIEKNNRLMKNE